MQTVRTLRLEAAVYLVILMAAAWLRLADLGWPPLSDAEASQALAAAALSGSPSPFDPAPDNPPAGTAYQVPTSVLFQLVGSSDTAARVLPAVAGLAVCLLPLLARRMIGPKLSLTLTAVLAFSPLMITASRQAGGTILACLGLAGFAVLLVDRDPTGAKPRQGIGMVAFGALALTSGAAWVQGVVGLGLGIAFTMLWWNRRGEGGFPAQVFALSRRELVIGLLLILAIATGFGLYPGGAADTFESLAAWLTGFSAASRMSILSAFLIIPFYEPLLLVFGIVGAVISFRRKDLFGIVSTFWALGALLIALSYPARSALDLIWVGLPGAYLASRGVLLLVEAVVGQSDWLRFAGMTGAFIVLSAFVELQLAAYASGLGVEFAILDPSLRLGIIFVALLIWIVLVVLFGTGWSWSTSMTALGVAVIGLLSAISVASIVRLNFAAAAAQGGQLWDSHVSAAGLHDLSFTLDFLSRAYQEDPGGLTITVEGHATPSLAWTVRGYDAEPIRATEQAPPVILAPAKAEPSLRADYLGQLLALAETNNWNGALPPDVLTWVVLHKAPVEFDDWLLLVRADVATQGGLTALGSETDP